MKVKKDLKDLNPTDSDFPEGTRLFKNDTLCPYYRVLSGKYKKLCFNEKKKDVCTKNISKEALHAVFQIYRINASPK